MRKILGIIVFLLVCGIVLFFATKKNEYAYVKSFVGDGERYAAITNKENDRLVDYFVAFDNPPARLVKIASKESDTWFDVEQIKSYMKATEMFGASWVWVRFIPDDALRGEEAERRCNYELLYVPENVTIDSFVDDGKFNSVSVCKKN